MISIRTFLLFNFVLFVNGQEVKDQNELEDVTNQENINEYFVELNEELRIFNRERARIAWDYSINTHDSNLSASSISITDNVSKWTSRKCQDMKEIFEVLNESQKRMYYLLCRGPTFSEYQERQLIKRLSSLQDIYINTKVCIPKTFPVCKEIDDLWKVTLFKMPNNDYYQLMITEDNFYVNPVVRDLEDQYKCFSGEPDLEQLMTGNDFSILFNGDLKKCQENKYKIYHWIWESWRLAVGPSIKEIYPEVVALMNTGARNGGYEDIGEIWRYEVEIKNLEELCKKLWEEVAPFYNMLHTFARSILQKKYKTLDSIDNFLPAHIFGNLWSSNWESLFHDEIAPVIFKNKFDLDKSFKEKNWTPLDLVKRAEDFYSSLGLSPMTEKFWTKSFINSAIGGNGTNCHGTAANMFDDGDYRMIVCAGKTFYDFYVVVHEMGHLQYYMNAEKQPTIFQDGNTAMQESIGDAIYLGLLTPVHLNRINLVSDQIMYPSSNEENFDLYILMKTAFAKIPQIPFEYLFDLFRWNLFNENVNFEESNDYFWFLLENYQGIKPPNLHLNRHNMFDIGAKYHLADNQGSYIRYFLASFIQAQVYKGLCEVTLYGKVNSGEKLPMDLHKCDIYGSKRAGNLLKKALGKGKSVPISEILKTFTGSEEVSSDALLEYYQPLIKWLENYFIKNNIKY